MSSQPSNSNAATKRALALALGVILIIIAALFLRRDPAEVVVAQAPPRGSVATPRVEPTPVPTDSQVEHETPAAVPVDSHATEISSAVSSEPEILIHVTAAIEGGCEIPRDAPVAFMQIMPGDQPAFIERRLLSEVGVDAGYTLHWQPGAIALGVHVESEVGAIPGMTFARQSLDGLRPGAYAVPPLKIEEIIVSNTARMRGPMAASTILHGAFLQRQGPPPAPEETKRSVTLTMAGICRSTVVLELPSDVSHSMIEDVEVFTSFKWSGAPYRQFPVDPALREKVQNEGILLPVQFEQLPGEVRIFPFSPAVYQVVVRTTDSRIWSSEKISLALGEERRLRVEFQQGARITARVTGATSPNAEITYRLAGFQIPEETTLFASKVEKPDQGTAYARDPRGVARADDSMEFIAIPGGSYTVFANESELIYGSLSVPVRTGEHREVVVDLGTVIPVTIEVVDQDGNLVQGDGYNISTRAMTVGMKNWRGPVGPVGRTTTNLSRGSYLISASGPDERDESTIQANVVARGDGDFFRIILNRSISLRGRVVDVDGKPVKGVGVSGTHQGSSRWTFDGLKGVTDENGEFAIQVAEGPLTVLATQGHVTAVANVNAPLPEGELLELRLVPLTLKGVVLDRVTNEPVADAQISVFMTSNSFDEEGYSSYGISFGLGFGGKSDEIGKFEISPLGPGTYSVRLLASGPIRSPDTIVELKSADDPPTVIYADGEGATLAGTIVDSEGRPIPRMQLLSVQRPGEVAILKMKDEVSDSEGRYECKSLSVGENMSAVFIQASNDTQPRYFLAHLAENLTLRQGETTTYDFVAISGARLVVHVVKADGMPVRGAEIRLMQSGEQVLDQARLTPGPNATDRNGRLMFRAIPPGTHTARATLEDGRTIEGTVTLDVWENKTVTLRVE